MPTHLNADGREKFRKAGWLISAITVEFNHLRGAQGASPKETQKQAQPEGDAWL
jgi:hypothetical protein